MSEDGPALDFPLDGTWRSLRSPGHDRYAFDLVAEDAATGRVTTARAWRYALATAPASAWHGWGRPVRAPFHARVAGVGEGWPDAVRVNVPHAMLRTLLQRVPADAVDLRPFAGNHVLLESDDGYGALLAHLRAGSVRVTEGDTVQAGAILGDVGNSGRSLVPHLHVQVMDGPDPRAARIIPFRFRRFERWENGAWRVVEDGALGKGERVRVGGRT